MVCWCVGVILYTILAGFSPFYGDSTTKVIEVFLREDLRFRLGFLGYFLPWLRIWWRKWSVEILIEDSQPNKLSVSILLIKQWVVLLNKTIYYLWIWTVDFHFWSNIYLIWVLSCLFNCLWRSHVNWNFRFLKTTQPKPNIKAESWIGLRVQQTQTFGLIQNIFSTRPIYIPSYRLFICIGQVHTG